MRSGWCTWKRACWWTRSPPEPPSPAAPMFLFRLLLKNAFRHRLRTAAHDAGPGGGGVRLRPAAHHRRRLVCRRRGQFQHAAHHAQRHLADRAAAAGLRRAAARGGRRATASAGPTGSAASTSPQRNFFPQFAVDPRHLPAAVPRIPPQRRRARWPGSATARAWSWAPSWRRSTAGSWATTSRCAAPSTPAPGTSRCAASTKAPTPGATRTRCSCTGHSSTKPCARRGGRGDFVGVFVVGIRDPNNAARDLASASTRSSAIRWPRR